MDSLTAPAGRSHRYGTFRRVDRRRRPFRHRRRLASAEEVPGQELRHPRGAREASGGTWDLFRYPGVRSDSDMYTLGYSFRPWKEAKAIADGPSILTYIREVARDHGIDQKIRYGHKVVAAAWSTPDARWTVEVETGPDRALRRFTCNFLWMCSGYYDYEAGYLPEFAGMDRFKGRIVHPQKWTDDIDYAGKRVVVIGSGATAVTLVPSMAEKAEHVTMLQRSPTYMVARPSQDATRQQIAPPPAPQARLLGDALAQRPPGHVFLPDVQAQAGQGEKPVAGRRAPDAGAGLRHRYALHAALQAVGPAALPRARRGFLPRHPPRQGLDRHRPDRDLHREPA